MTEKITFFTLLGAALVLGYPGGFLLAKLFPSSRRLASMIGFVGALVFFIGIVAVDEDHRFRLVADFGLCLQVSGIVSSFKIKRPMRLKSVEWWASPREPNQSSRPTPGRG